MKRILVVISLLVIFLITFGVKSYLDKTESSPINKVFSEYENGTGTGEKTGISSNQPDLSKDTPSGAEDLSGANETAAQTQDTSKSGDGLTLEITGDILLGRGVEKSLKENSKDYSFVFEKVADYLKHGDIIFGNLEEPITDRSHSLTGIGSGGKWVLRSRTQAFTALKMAGFNMLSLANNHILDYYNEGLSDTVKILDSNNIAHAGAGNNLEEARSGSIVEKNGVKIGLLAYTDMAEITYKGNPPLKFVAGSDKPGVAPRKLEMIKQDIAGFKPRVDILIVSLHWGVEDSFDIQDSQVEFAHSLIDCGADIIAGHHPHQFQGIEIYNGKPIFYSLGNFMFDQNDPENQESFYLSLKYSGTKLAEMTAYPVRTIDKCQVVPQKGKDASDLLEREMKLCRELGTDCGISGDTIDFNLE